MKGIINTGYGNLLNMINNYWQMDDFYIEDEFTTTSTSRILTPCNLDLSTDKGCYKIDFIINTISVITSEELIQTNNGIILPLYAYIPYNDSSSVAAQMSTQKIYSFLQYKATAPSPSSTIFKYAYHFSPISFSLFALNDYSHKLYIDLKYLASFGIAKDTNIETNISKIKKIFISGDYYITRVGE